MKSVATMPNHNNFFHDWGHSLAAGVTGMAGGLTKAFSSGLLLNVTMDGSITVMVYAVMSAACGYIAKEGLDFVRESVVKRKRGGQNG